MRFSRLEIKGFKSFANETVIHFNEDVTGIVGPNGSGKSNIVDAIRWVLGEQKSTELRLDKMSNIIFNGTKSKKPAGMAQVSLVFENNKKILPLDFNEVTVTRILYQNGDSEYKLNNVTCRLKDIYSLFVDTGVGSNTYAIIGFGMVEDLLNNKDNYRRMMIEQAAGISKYKSRKKETLSKLQSTLDDLSRVDDLLAEIEGNMNTLRKQARRAEKYLELKERYKANASTLFNHQIKSINQSIISTFEKYERERKAAELKETEIHNIEALVEVQKAALLEKELVLSEFQKKTNIILENQKALEKKRDMNIQRIAFIKSRADQSISDLGKLKMQLQELNMQKSALITQLPDTETEIISLKSDLETKEAQLKEIKLQLGSIESGLAPVLAAYDAANNRQYEIEKQNAIANAQLLSIQSDTGKNKAHEEELSNQLTSLTNQLNIVISVSTTKTQELNAALDIVELENANLALKKEALEAFTEKKKLLERRSDNIEHESKLLRSLIDNLEGYPEAVKYLSSNVDKSRKFYLLADLINCDEKYRTALENYLAPYLTNFVVPDYNDAFNAINLLSSSQKGKAGFFIMEAFKDKKNGSPEIDGAIPLTSLIQCHPQYQPLFNHLLQDAYLVHKVGASSFDSLKIYPGAHFIAEDGSIIVSRGQAAGGSIGLVEGSLLGRKLRLENLEEEIRILKKEDSELFIKISDLEDEIKLINQMTVRPQIEILQRDLQKLNDNSLQLKVKIENVTLQLQKITSDELLLMQKLTEFHAVIENNAAPLVLLKADLIKLNIEIQQNKTNQKEKGDEFNQLNTLINSLKMNLVQVENKSNSINREVNLIDQQIINLNNNSKQLENTQQQSLIEIASLESNIHETESEIVAMSAAFKGSQNELSEVEKLYFSDKKIIAEEEQNIKINQRNLSGIQTMANEWKDKWQAAKYEAKRIEDNFEIEFGAIPEQESEASGAENDISVIADQNLKLKNSILQFGEVNPLALEAYQEIKIRYDEIVAQKTDILESKEMLAQTLNELEATSTTKYLSAFDQVRDNFKMVFRSLFTEDDDCDLIIENEGNPLDSDISIIAKPKGKRPQSLNQLSGGEKTLTAIAFLFSLYLLKPAPFCIFDELDAPLDDVNVEKLNRIIRKFSAQSQFIIITHNKATMASVDVMYGVYMEQQGISGLSKVDFRAYEHNMILEKVEN